MTKKILIRNWQHRQRRTVRLAEPPKDSLTQQQFRDDCDINQIVARAQRGIPPRFTARGEPHFGDFSEVPDLVSAYDLVERANEAFMTLPAQLRLELGNDPLRINELTREQIERYELNEKLPATPLASGVPSSSPEAGQASPNGGVPAHPEPKGSKKPAAEQQE